jgi:hypothetical protein
MADGVTPLISGQNGQMLFRDGLVTTMQVHYFIHVAGVLRNPTIVGNFGGN